MLAAIEREASPNKSERLCVVRWTGRKRWHVEILTVCGDGVDASDNGVVQVPDFVLDGRPVLSISDFGGKGRKQIKICDDCKKAFGG